MFPVALNFEVHLHSTSPTFASLMMSQRFHLVGGKTTPLKNDGVRPLG
jgi:hypothetical protein